MFKVSGLYKVTNNNKDFRENTSHMSAWKGKKPHKANTVIDLECYKGKYLFS